MRTRLVTLLAAASCSLPTLANPFTPASLSVGGWSYHPVFAQGHVDSIVAIRTTPVGASGIIGLLCRANPDGTWAFESWDTASIEEIVIHLAETHAESRWAVADAFADLPLDTPMLLDPTIVGVAPVPFDQGLKSADPLQPFVRSSADPHATLEILELLGYPAVSTLSVAPTTGSNPTPSDDPPHIPDDCTQVTADAWLHAIASTFTHGRDDPSIPDMSLGGILGVLSQCCEPFVLTLPPGSSPWTCGDFRLTEVFHNFEFQQCIYAYDRVVTRVESRVRLEGDANCRTRWCLQTRSCAAFQYDSCYTNARPTLPPGGTCEGTFCPPPARACAPTGAPECNTWFPATCP